jgi:hypothetical protein
MSSSIWSWSSTGGGMVRISGREEGGVDHVLSLPLTGILGGSWGRGWWRSTGLETRCVDSRCFLISGHPPILSCGWCTLVWAGDYLQGDLNLPFVCYCPLWELYLR